MTSNVEYRDGLKGGIFPSMIIKICVYTSGRVGEGVRADAVPRHLHAGGARAEDQAQRGQDSGENRAQIG